MGQIDWDLLNASTNGDLEKAKWAIENGADVNAKDDKGRTSLYHASFDGHDNIVSLLLEKEADVNAKDHVASEFGYEAPMSMPKREMETRHFIGLS
jgi:ankyrin repeat protein